MKEKMNTNSKGREQKEEKRKGIKEQKNEKNHRIIIE